MAASLAGGPQMVATGACSMSMEMYIGDIQERARLLPDAVPGINRTKATSNLQFLAWQQQSRSFSGNH